MVLAIAPSWARTAQRKATADEPNFSTWQGFFTLWLQLCPGLDRGWPTDEGKPVKYSGKGVSSRHLRSVVIRDGPARDVSSLQTIVALAARDGAPQSVFEVIVDTEEELRTMDAMAAEWQDGRPEKLLQLLAPKRQMHCYRCSKPYYKADGKQHSHLKADCPKNASQAEFNGEPLKVWAKNKPLAENLVPAYNQAGQRSLHTLQAQAEIDALKTENA